jgi:hypothetical protein
MTPFLLPLAIGGFGALLYVVRKAAKKRYVEGSAGTFVPVVATQRATDIIESDDPFPISMPDFGSFSAPDTSSFDSGSPASDFSSSAFDGGTSGGGGGGSDW